MKTWLRARTVADVEAFYEAKYARDGLRAFTAPPAERREWMRLIEAVAGPVTRQTRVLDAGCGTGELLGELAAKTELLVGFEISPTAAQLARHRLGAAASIFQKPMEGAGIAFPEAFDVVACLGALEHTMAPREAFLSLLDALAPGGTLIIALPVEFDGCATAIEAEPDPTTNERFASAEEWQAVLGMPADHTVAVGTDIVLAYKKQEKT